MVERYGGPRKTYFFFLNLPLFFWPWTSFPHFFFFFLPDKDEFRPIEFCQHILRSNLMYSLYIYSPSSFLFFADSLWSFSIAFFSDFSFLPHFLNFFSDSNFFLPLFFLILALLWPPAGMSSKSTILPAMVFSTELRSPFIFEGSPGGFFTIGYILFKILQKQGIRGSNQKRWPDFGSCIRLSRIMIELKFAA